MHISHSSLKTFQECPRKYWYRYNAGRIPNRDSAALYIGTAAHEATALWWTDGPDAAREYLMKHADEIDIIDAARLVAVLSIYNPPRDRYEVTGVEVPFKLPVKNPTTMHGIPNIRQIGFIDLELRDLQTGEKVIREFKTTSSEIIGFTPYWARLAVDAQIAIYSLATGTSRIIYDVIRKPKLRPSATDRKNAGPGATDVEVMQAFTDRVIARCQENPAEWHQWREIHKTPSDIEHARTNLYEMTRQLQFAVKRNQFPQFSHSCNAMFGTCPYLEVCAGRADLDDDVLFRDYVRQAV